jgi:hypothetical protein
MFTLRFHYPRKEYADEAPAIYISRAKCLAALAYPNFFPDAHIDDLRPLVSQAILAASPGWCGSFGPGVYNAIDIIDIPHHSHGAVSGESTALPA